MEKGNRIPMWLSVVFAVITAILFRAGYSNLAWMIIIIGGSSLGILYGLRSKRKKLRMASQLKKCPSCSEEIQLEAKVCRYCGHEFDDAQILEIKESLQAETSQAPALGASRTCPRCAETIKLEALVCNYCGNYFNEQEVKAEKEKYQKKAQKEEKVKQAQKLRRRISIHRGIGFTVIAIGSLITLLWIFGVVSDISQGKTDNFGIWLSVFLFVCAPPAGIGVLFLIHSRSLEREVEKIRKSIENNSEESRSEESKVLSLEERIESLRVKFNELSEKITNSKSGDEKIELRREREEIENEMNSLRGKLSN